MQKIFLVEDAKHIIIFLAGILQRKYDLQVVANFAMAKTRLEKEQCSVLVVDFGKACEDNFARIREFVAFFPTLPILILGSKIDMTALERAVPHALWFSTDKPIMQNHILYVIKKAAQASSKEGEKNSEQVEVKSKDSSSKENLNLPKSILLIDDDESVVALFKKEYSPYCRIDGYVSGDMGWNASLEFQYEFILLDWRLTDSSGLTLFNRFRRSEQYKITPIMIISGFIKKKDFSLLGEFPLSELLEKPLQISHVTARIQYLMREAVWFCEQEEKIYDFFEQLEKNKISDFNTIANFLNRSPNPYPLALIAGRILRRAGNLNLAEQLIRFALKSKENLLMGLNELGKIYLSLGKNAEAQKFLLKAMEISPDNIERICDLGEASLKQKDVEGAEKFFKKARAIDEQDEYASSGIKLSENIKEFMKTGADIPETYAGMLNAVGISMVRRGKLKEGLSHYEAALSHLQDEEDKAKLFFNVGMGYLRGNDLKTSLAWFEKTLRILPKFDKAQKYVKLVKEKMSSKSSGDSELVEIEVGNFSSSKKPEAVEPDEFSLFEEFEKESPKFGSIEKNNKQDDNLVEKLKEAAPNIDKLFSMMINDGEYVANQVPYLYRLLSQHGAQKFRKAIDIAIKNKVSSLMFISNVLFKVSSQD